MGIPKMFRWLSERYPLVSQLVEENAIPEFDNLYLDMNGIVHNATHANKGSHLVLSDEQMFTAIFGYIDDLFEKIKPKKVFYMAVDGVAPRAKMNQQRARRFRTAQERQKDKAQAEQKGIKVEEDTFDSNCITPGTVFMENLTKNLKYFINKKITEDDKWKNIDVILSSHEVPGEGEHKIMEYIRACKAQPDYDPNVRHCLYGLDADLIMLGLLSHDPHFALLREEVTFGKKNKPNRGPPRFFLLHLSLVREYLDAEFSEVKGEMKFEYNLESIIDDFIMMVMFVGNDFLPHLPGFDIGEGVLTELLRAYTTWLKIGDGYMNNNGIVNFKRLELFLRSLDRFEYKQFLDLPDNVDILVNEMMGFGQFKITEKQLNWTKTVLAAMDNSDGNFELNLENVKTFKDIEFIKHLASDLDLKLSHEYQKQQNALDEMPSLIYSISNNESDIETETDDENVVILNKARNSIALKKIASKYLDAPIISNQVEIDDRNEADQVYSKWKEEYYKNKLQIDKEDEESMNKLILSYIEGIQWVMYYYYHGIKSWGWYYPYHFAPMLSDLKGLSKMSIDFELGSPFKPFEQLMGVLPPLSKTLVPHGLRELMTNPSSSIIDFYPMDFEYDMNGKKNSWEAVVKIPFIDEKRLLNAIKTQEHLLLPEEKKRNTFGQIYLYKYDEKLNFTYETCLPGYLPNIRSSCKETIYELPKLGNGIELRFGLCDGVEYGPNAPPGFPSIFSLPITSSVKFGGLQVFDRATKNESVIINVINNYQNIPIEDIVNQYLGKCIFIGYPYLNNSKLVKVSTSTYEYILDNGRISKIPVLEDGEKEFFKVTKEIENNYKIRKGVNIGTIDTLFYYAPFVAMTRTLDGSLIQHYAENVPPTPYPSQLSVFSINREDPRYKEIASLPIEQAFPIKCKAFFLGDKYYGTPCQVIGHNNNTISIKLLYQADNTQFCSNLVRAYKTQNQYLIVRDLARMNNCLPIAISRLTSKVKLSLERGKKIDNTINIGLGLKFDGRGEMVIGYCRKGIRGWEFSPKACELITSFCKSFPEVIRFLGTDEASQSIIPATSIYPNNTVENVDKVLEFIKANGIKDFVLSPVDSESLDASVVYKIQNYWDEHYLKHTKIDVIEIHNVPKSALLRHSDDKMQLSRQKFNLGDRVIYIKESSKVPITLRGTIIGIENNNIEVIFDRTFANGTNLDMRCQDFRGAWVQSNYLLNLSYQQLNQSNIQKFLNMDIVKNVNVNNNNKNMNMNNTTNNNGSYSSVAYNYNNSNNKSPNNGSRNNNNEMNTRGRGRGRGSRGRGDFSYNNQRGGYENKNNNTTK